jgi:PAS domain S-box-containing protein
MEVLMDSLFQVLDSAADGAYAIDEDQHIVYWNKAAEEILGYTSEEVVGRACFEILGGLDDHGHAICRHHCHVSTTALTGSPVTSYDTCARTRSGQARWINISILTLPTSENSNSLVIHLFRDATEKKQSEQFTRQVLNAAKSLRGAAGLRPTAPELAGTAAELTDREREVLTLLAQGLSTRDIAEYLSISPSTARNHVQNVLHKLNVHSRLEAVSYAFEHGLV